VCLLTEFGFGFSGRHLSPSDSAFSGSISDHGKH